MKTNGKDKLAHENGGVDWQAIYQELQSAEAKVASHDISEELTRQIWSRRAAQLAKKDDRLGEEKQVELLLLRLGSEVYAIDVHYVYDIRPARKMTRVPRVPSWVSGVVNMRGRIVSAIDLRRYLGLPEGDFHEKETNGPAALKGAAEKVHQDQKALVLVEAANMEVVLVVDEVLSVGAFSESRFQSPSGTVRGLNPEYVSSISNRGPGVDTLFVVLDLSAIITDKRLLIQEETL
jgi:purine-binding chemotaxis protein CheW